jgi:hypothetical protein
MILGVKLQARFAVLDLVVGKVSDQTAREGGRPSKRGLLLSSIICRMYCAGRCMHCDFCLRTDADRAVLTGNFTSEGHIRERYNVPF